MLVCTKSGRTALVTGSSRGIGADTARYLAEGGANVVINFRNLPVRVPAGMGWVMSGLLRWIGSPAQSRRSSDPTNYLAEGGANVVINFRNKAPRAEKLAAQLRELGVEAAARRG
jgi:NAD(P)-dependent dehydrogenase (short-subunit alcohol dehydrogenase family)